MAFTGKVVIVTGASSGIGAATAIKFAAEGARVCLVGRNQQKLNNVAKQCGDPLVVVADISRDEDAERIVSETVARYGRLDVLVNNAGMTISAHITQDDVITVYDQVAATNLRAPVLLAHLAVPHLVRTRGNIVNVSSVCAVMVPTTNSFAYNTSKAALDHFSRSIALELAPKGVRVNVVNPGPVRTDILDADAKEMKVEVEDLFEVFKQKTALNRVSDPGEVADVILFLASDKAVAITGSSYFTDNGMTIKGN